MYSTRTQTVFGIGPIDPEVAFVGEAPGADEDRLGEPFVGRAGQLLTRIIQACGFEREEVYIFNILKCRPPNNRTPTTAECANCRPFFDRQFELVKPKHLVALGGTAAKTLINTSTGITRLRGKVYEYRGIPLICTFHPSALLRDESGRMKRDCWEDMKLLLRTMGRPIPNVKRS
jgi:DNA polymerase